MENSENLGKLYLIPSLMGDVEPLEVLPLSAKKVIDMVEHYIVENEKSARAFIKRVHPGKAQDRLEIKVLNKFTEPEDIPGFLDPCMVGQPVGILSEAGAPGVADPGAEVVNIAHERGIRVVPLVGPSSILLAVMASGMNGQNFAFNGYLPIDKAERKREIIRLEKHSQRTGQSQVFIETPYRNHKLVNDLLKYCNPQTRLCIARELTLPSEFIKTATIGWWQKNVPDLEKKPSIFVLQG